MQYVLGVSGRRLRESRTAGGLFRGEANTSTFWRESVRTVSWGYNIGKSMLCSTQTQRLDHYIRCLLKRGFYERNLVAVAYYNFIKGLEFDWENIWCFASARLCEMVA